MRSKINKAKVSGAFLLALLVFSGFTKVSTAEVYIPVNPIVTVPYDAVWTGYGRSLQACVRLAKEAGYTIALWDYGVNCYGRVPKVVHNHPHPQPQPNPHHSQKKFADAVDMLSWKSIGMASIPQYIPEYRDLWTEAYNLQQSTFRMSEQAKQGATADLLRSEYELCKQYYQAFANKFYPLHHKYKNMDAERYWSAFVKEMAEVSRFF